MECHALVLSFTMPHTMGIITDRCHSSEEELVHNEDKVDDTMDAPDSSEEGGEHTRVIRNDAYQRTYHQQYFILCLWRRRHHPVAAIQEEDNSMMMMTRSLTNGGYNNYTTINRLEKVIEAYEERVGIEFWGFEHR